MNNALSIPALESAIKNIEDLGYELRQHNQHYDQQGNLVTSKVLFCERSQVYALLQTIKLVSDLEGQDMYNNQTEIKETTNDTTKHD